MRVYIGFDDTDTIDSDFGTGKLARFFEGELPSGCRLWGVVRQQLLIDDRIPYTSRNSSACAVVDFDDPSLRNELLTRAVSHIGPALTSFRTARSSKKFRLSRTSKQAT